MAAYKLISGFTISARRSEGHTVMVFSEGGEKAGAQLAGRCEQHVKIADVRGQQSAFSNKKRPAKTKADLIGS